MLAPYLHSPRDPPNPLPDNPISIPCLQWLPDGGESFGGEGRKGDEGEGGRMVVDE